MKHINKSAEPAAFSDWKARHPGATYKDDLSNTKDKDSVKTKAALKRALLAEQKYLCCYCECEIDSATSHIEHFKPKGLPEYSSLQLDYNNLHASCTKVPTGQKEEHCGHKKGDSFSTNMVSPLEPDCSRHFSYLINGTIGHTDARGEDTIRILNLDSALLNSKRKKFIDYFLIDCDEENLEEEITCHLDTGSGKLGEFYTMIDYLHSKGLL